MLLTKSELQIMQLLWREGRPLTRAEILSGCADKTWKDNSIHILLNGLLKKDAICEAGFARSCKVWAREYAPEITAAEYYKDSAFDQLGVNAVPELFKAMISQDGVTVELIDQLLEILKERRAELPGERTEKWKY